MILHSQLVNKLRQLGFDIQEEKDGFLSCRSSHAAGAVTTFKIRADYSPVSARSLLERSGFTAAHAWVEATEEENKTAE